MTNTALHGSCTTCAVISDCLNNEVWSKKLISMLLVLLGRGALLNKPYLVNWSIVCLDKQKEGLGFINLLTFYRALLGK